MPAAEEGDHVQANFWINAVRFFSSFPISTIDITGGSPEMKSTSEWFLDEASLLNRRLIVRSNLTLLLEEHIVIS